ncbi:unnamed protein product [Acanthoscelides obtectus]|uniref:UDP-glucuronosyltransferase n=1 Tax=Acanthoscelides obtectus TaxID=200917 RepID=A0A9P0LPZ5_ACAOB
MRALFTSAVIVNVLCLAQCYKILTVFPTAAPSHFILGEAIARGLAEAGHDVTMVSPFETKNPPKNGKVKDVVLTGLIEEHNRTVIHLFQMEQINMFTHILAMNFMGNRNMKKVLDHPNLQKLLKSGEKFDAVVMEQFLNDGLKPLAKHFNAHLILFSTIGPNMWVNGLVGNPDPSSYIPDWNIAYPIEMNLYQRTWNLIIKTIWYASLHLLSYPGHKKIAEEYLPKGIDFDTALYNVSLVLCNSHESTNQAVPVVPNMVQIGGFHIKPPKKLPQELQDFMDSAKEGVIYFSLGSNIVPSTMGEEKKMAILKAFGKLKQKVLWKWNEDTIPGKPDNVKLAKWFPQQDLLAHPNMRLFVTHGGLLSAFETIYHGIPVLALPIFADQSMNAARAQEAGFGLFMPFSEITEQKLDEALQKLLNDPKYAENAKRRSSYFHDRPIKPMDLTTYWIEYVIRHKGAEHLRVAGAKLPWYQYYSLDSIVVILLVITSPYFLLKFFLRLRKKSAKAKKE